MATIRLDYRPEESFEGALARVKALMDEKKRGDLGLNGFVKLDLVYRLLGDRIANRLLRRRLNNPLICMTNIGILDSERIAFGDRRPRDAFICGSIKHKALVALRWGCDILAEMLELWPWIGRRFWDGSARWMILRRRSVLTPWRLWRVTRTRGRLRRSN
jgi:NRPS condensation-like uncharacterized protein